MADQRAQKQQHKQEIAAYEKKLQSIKIKPNVLVNTVWAFIIGGLICVIGQLILNGMLELGLPKSEAGTASSIILIFLGALFTGIGVYDELGKVGGAGSIVPITGFANSIVASAMDYKHEGYVFGVGARLFQIAGPVLVYGFVASIAVGLLFWIFTK